MTAHFHTRAAVKRCVSVYQIWEIIRVFYAVRILSVHPSFESVAHNALLSDLLAIESIAFGYFRRTRYVSTACYSATLESSTLDRPLAAAHILIHSSPIPRLHRSPVEFVHNLSGSGGQYRRVSLHMYWLMCMYTDWLTCAAVAASSKASFYFLFSVLKIMAAGSTGGASYLRHTSYIFLLFGASSAGFGASASARAHPGGWREWPGRLRVDGVNPSPIESPNTEEIYQVGVCHD